MTGTPSFRSRSSRAFVGRQRAPSSAASLQTQLENDNTVWELERRVTIWHQQWHTPFLPHDGHKKKRWMAIMNGSYAPHPSLPTTTSGTSFSEWSAPPIAAVEFLGEERRCSWQTLVDAKSDEKGWQYAVDFYGSDSQWTSYPCGFSHVRRRRWTPTFSSQSMMNVIATDAPTNGRLQKRSRAKSTLLDSKGLSTSEKTVFAGDIGAAALDTLARALEVDDWESTKQLMALYFQSVKAEDLVIQEWTTLHGVKGKTRTVEMKVPVAPMPMCPAETRVHQTWHVSSAPAKIILESVTTSLDVPYGTTFNVVVCDTFTCKENSTCVHMVRTCAVDWVSSIWLTSLVEQNVHTQVREAGERWAGLLQEWLRDNA
mmetsp:Transcript_65761/g.175163  ORF Transcript_65761/g.175163 Transcript_65761/m.175163 type:complete len:371 (-) Transcript_65761:29-1141(-)